MGMSGPRSQAGVGLNLKQEGKQTMLQAYTKFLDGVEKIEKLLLTITFPAMVAIMLYQVILRYVFSNSNAWSEELTRYLFIFNVMIAAAIAVRRNSHLQIDILINRFGPRTKRIFTIAATAIGIAFLAMLFVYSLELCRMGTSNISPGVGISMSIPYASVPIGIVLMVLTSIEVILKNVQELNSSEEGDAS